MAVPIGPYEGQDLTSYEEGNKFLPRQFYSLNSPTITGQNTNAGIVSTQAANPYKWPPWPPIRGGADDFSNIPDRYDPNQNLGTTNITDYEADAADVGSTWAGSWAKAKDDFSKLPLPSNLIKKGIRHWKERRDIKRAEKQQADKDAKDAADAAAAGQGTNIGGGWTQTNRPGGGATFSGAGGTTHEGWSNTPAGFAAAAESEGTHAQGGRVGYRWGESVDPEEPAEDIREIMRGENIPFSDQVEGEEGILEQLIAKYIEAGFPPDQAEEMAMQEFQQMTMGSEQGIASLV